MLTYLKGDATRPVPRAPTQPVDGVARPIVICHVCNNRGAWGAGFVLAVSNRWAAPEAVYRAEGEQRLGRVQLVQVGPDLWVANMIAQDGFARKGRECALDYHALAECLVTLRQMMPYAEFHMPRIGCGLGGGDWRQVERLLDQVLGQKPVFVYDFDQS